jgi:plasmid maintenance system antidote protein VapI
MTVMSKRKDRLDPVHPGDVLREDFMKPLGLSAYAVAKALGVTPIARRLEKSAFSILLAMSTRQKIARVDLSQLREA